MKSLLGKRLEFTNLYGHGMWYGQWHLLNDMDGHMLRCLRVSGGCVLVLMMIISEAGTTSTSPTFKVPLASVLRRIAKGHAADEQLWGL